MVLYVEQPEPALLAKGQGDEANQLYQLGAGTRKRGERAPC